MILKSLHLHLPHSLRRRHQLTIHIRYADTVRIHYRQVLHTTPHKSFRTPAADTPDTEKNHPHLGQRLHHIRSQQKFSPVKYRFF